MVAMKDILLFIIFSIILILIFFLMPLYVVFCVWDSTLRNRWRYYKYVLLEGVCEIADLCLGIENYSKI